MNSGTFYVPGSHPTPSFVLPVLGFSSWSFLVGLVGSSSSMEALLRLLYALHAFNACITSERGEVAKTATPPFRIITIATLGLLGF